MIRWNLSKIVYVHEIPRWGEAVETGLKSVSRSFFGTEGDFARPATSDAVAKEFEKIQNNKKTLLPVAVEAALRGTSVVWPSGSNTIPKIQDGVTTIITGITREYFFLLLSFSFPHVVL